MACVLRGIFRRTAPLLLGVVLAPGCADGGGEGTGTDGATDSGGTDGGTDTGPGPDESDALYDPDHVVEVDIQLGAADWDALRVQTRDLDILMGEDCQAEPFGSPFTWFPATTTVDGVTLDTVGVRKKGFLGSLDEEKPSLKLDFQEYVPDQWVHGVKRMTLNNAKQDPAVVRQCLVYQLFSAAGLTSSRCNFAHVTVNDVDMGVYVNVEPVKKPFLRRHYASDAGNLYEGTLSDFREGWLDTFEKKTNKLDPDRSDLDRMAAALDGPDDGLVDRLSAEMNVDQFIDFWAMEVLTDHWDGYAGNNNNFFVYRVPAQDRFEFLPWGVDGVLGKQPSEPPHSVMAHGELARRLYGIPATRDQYRDRMQTFLDTVWLESELQAEIDRMEALVVPIGEPIFDTNLPGAIADVRAFVDGRRALIEDELAAAAPGWTEEPRGSMCLVPTGNVDMQFDTTFGTIDAPDPFGTGTATLTADYFGQALNVQAIGSQAGTVIEESDGSERAEVRVVAQLDTGDVAIVVLNMAPPLFTPATYPVEFGEVGGAALLLDPQAGNEVTYVGNLFGEMTLVQAGTAPDAPVVGSFVGEVLLFGG